jgi:hypothetical protein
MYYTAEANVNSGTFLCPTTDHKNKIKMRGNISAHHIATAYMSLRLREKRKKIRQAAVQTENVTSSALSLKKVSARSALPLLFNIYGQPASQPANVYVLSVAGNGSRRARDLHKGKPEREKKNSKRNEAATADYSLVGRDH